jgi:uncharacterized protein
MRSATSLTRTSLLQGAFALFACAALSASAVAASIDMPPVAEPQSAEHHVGKVIWADLVTPDLGSAERFYGGLFGWTFSNFQAGSTNYAVARLDGRPVGGLFERALSPAEQRQPAWLTFIAVSDVESTRKIALAHGATVLAEPRYLPHRGRQAVLSDPEGAVFAVLASSSGDPPDYMAQPGEWIWSSLLATDPDTDAAFYQELFGYDVFELQSDDGLQHLILSTDDFSRASVNTLPADGARRHPHWINFVRVTDTVSTANTAVTLGGRVLVEPRVDRHGSKVAVIADPSGAPIGLMEWSEAMTSGEAK